MFIRSLGLTLIGLLFGVVVAEAIDSLPSILKSCEVNDEACLINQVLTTCTEVYKNGIPELQIPPEDPMSLGDIHIDSGSPGSQFQFNLFLKNITLHKFGDTSRVTKIGAFTKDVSKPFKLSWEISTSEMEFRGQYEGKGKILILPIESKGDIRINLKNSKFQTQVEVTPEKRSDGHTYLKIDNYKTNVILGTGHIDLTNLFNGDEELSKSTLKVLNDEWEAVSVDVKPKLGQAADRAFRKFVQRLYDAIPYDLLVHID